MNKRITAFLLCFIMVFSMLVTAIPAHAVPVESTQITITPDKTTATAGDIITYTIKMGPVSDMGTLQMQLVIPEGLTYVANSGKLADGLKTTLGFDDVAFTEASLVINGVAVFADYESDTDTEIATFQCKVNDGFSGNASVGLTYLEFYSCQTWTNHTSRFSVVEGQVLVESTADPYTKLGDVSAVTATADLTPTLGATTSAVSFTITEPTDAAAKGVIISGTSWYKKDASSIYGWTQCSNGVDTFKEGTYRLSVQLRSKSNDDKEYYAMSDATTFTVNGVQWNSEEPFRDNYATSGYGYRFFVSPEFTLGGKTLDSIAVTTPPTKTAYREGEDFNPAGMVVTATYTDSSTAPVILYTVTDGTDMVAGKTSVTISYTEGGVTETTTQPITVAKEYTVTVNGGTGNGEYIAGEEVSISAFVSTGMQFKEWQGTDGLTFTSGDKNSQTATFTMPAHDVTVTAVTGPAEYYVSVSGGSGTGMYEAGATVTIVADPPEAGKQFKEWSVGDGKVLRFTESDITSSTAKFIMPGEAVRIGATYEDITATKTPIDTVNISDLAKPVVGEMPNNSITVTGTGVTVDIDGSYWGRFVSPSFSPVYDDDTAVDSVVFREGETYMFQLYLNAAAGYEFTADSKFYFASDLLPAPDMTDLSKSFAMVNPSDSTQAVIYINMNDIAHIHVPGDWDFNDTHHWRKCTASGCDAGADVSRLPDYAEHSFVNGLCTCGAHKHSWSADWSVNETHHWHECSANGCTVTDNSGKDGYAAHDFTAGACVCGVENVITSIEINGITSPVAGETPINSASVDKVGAEVDEENTFWVRYNASTGSLSDTYTDGTFVYNTPFRDGETYLLQITIKPKTGYSFTADTKLLYGGTELSAPDVANPTASCGAIAPDCSMAMALINPTGASAPLTYTVSFVANGGTGTMADVTGISGEYTLPENGFTAPDGKQFKAWSVGGSEKAVGDKITVTADTTVTAVWETIPAGHTCDIKSVAKVNPSCTEGGKEAYYKCEGCGKFYEDALGTKEITDLASWGNLAKLGHTESDWKSDKDNHWKECTVAACGVIIENSKAAHADANNDGKCDVCEYNVGKTSTNPGNKPSDDVQNPQTGDNSMMGLWIALLFVSGFGVVTTTVYGKKRKSVK